MRLPIVNDVVRHNPPKVRKRRMALKAGMFTTGRSSVHLFRERERLFDSGRGGRGHMNPPDDLPPIEQQWSALVGWEGELGQLIRAHDAPLPNSIKVSTAGVEAVAPAGAEP